MLPRDKVTIYGKAEGMENIYNRKKDHYANLENQKFVEKEEQRKVYDQEKLKS